MAAQDAQQRDPQGEFLLHTIITKVSTELYITHILYEIQMKKQKKVQFSYWLDQKSTTTSKQISNAN